MTKTANKPADVTDVQDVSDKTAVATAAVEVIDLFDLFDSDPKLVEKGVWVPLGGGAEFLIGRAGNAAYNARLRELYEANMDLVAPAAANASEAELEERHEKALKVFIEAEAAGVLLGWKGPVTYKKKSLEYSKENAIKMLNMPDFRRLVLGWASRQDLFRTVVLEQDEKN